MSRDLSCIKAHLLEKYPISPSRGWGIKNLLYSYLSASKSRDLLISSMNWSASNFQPLDFVISHWKGWKRWSPITRITSSLQTCVAVYGVPASFSLCFGCFGCMQSPGHCTTMDYMQSVPISAVPPHRHGMVPWQGHLGALVSTGPSVFLYGEDCLHTLGFGSRKLLVPFSHETACVEGHLTPMKRKF